jgi:hypothetical protein
MYVIQAHRARCGSVETVVRTPHRKWSTQERESKRARERDRIVLQLFTELCSSSSCPLFYFLKGADAETGRETKSSVDFLTEIAEVVEAYSFVRR